MDAVIARRAWYVQVTVDRGAHLVALCHSPVSTVPHHGANSGCRSAATGPRTSGQEPSALSCGGELFTAGNLVLLASGKTVPISQLKTGDTVLASDTKSGKDHPRPSPASSSTTTPTCI